MAMGRGTSLINPEKHLQLTRKLQQEMGGGSMDPYEAAMNAERQINAEMPNKKNNGKPEKFLGFTQPELMRAGLRIMQAGARPGATVFGSLGEGLGKEIDQRRVIEEQKRREQVTDRRLGQKRLDDLLERMQREQIAREKLDINREQMSDMRDYRTRMAETAQQRADDYGRNVDAMVAYRNQQRQAAAAGSPVSQREVEGTAKYKSFIQAGLPEVEALTRAYGPEFADLKAKYKQTLTDNFGLSGAMTPEQIEAEAEKSAMADIMRYKDELVAVMDGGAQDANAATFNSDVMMQRALQDKMSQMGYTDYNDRMMRAGTPSQEALLSEQQIGPRQDAILDAMLTYGQ